MHQRAEDLQGLAPDAAQRRRYGAAAALILGLTSAAHAEPPPVTVSGYLQADVVPWSEASVDELDPATRQPLNEERVLIRRARIRVETSRDALAGAVELDGNTQSGATARLLGAQVRYTLGSGPAPLLVATAGLFKTPFGAEVPASERDKPFLEPPAFARALFPGNYDGGVMVHGAYGVARWSVAAMNGAPVGDAQWKGKDPVSSFELVGRLGAVVEGSYRSRFEVGVSALSGQGLHPGTPATKDSLQWNDDNGDGIVQVTELTTIPGTAATPSQTFERTALGLDAQVHWCLCRIGTGLAFAELAVATNLDRSLVYADPVAVSRDLRELGFAVGVVQDLGPYAQVGVRYDRYAADRDASERAGVTLVGVDKVFSTLGVMAAGRWHTGRFVVQYDHEKNPFGRGDNGEPTTRAADRVTLRAQVGF